MIVTLAFIRAETAKVFAVSVAELKGRTRPDVVAHARFAFVGLSCRYTGKSLRHIGAFLGGRDISTICHARTRFFELLADEDFLNRAALVEAAILEHLHNQEVFNGA